MQFDFYVSCITGYTLMVWLVNGQWSHFLSFDAKKGFWIGVEHRYIDGQEWTRHIRKAITDDFGNLVEVPA